MQTVLFPLTEAGNLHVFRGFWDPLSCSEHPQNGRVQRWMVLGLEFVAVLLSFENWIGYENLYRIPPAVILMLNVQAWFSILKIHIILLRLGEVGELTFTESKF